jgi:Smg protein
MTFSILGNNMKTEVMDVLQYIFERFQEEAFVAVDKTHTLVNELKEVGFNSGEIDSALDWLDGLVDASSESFAPVSSSQQHIRIYHPHELNYFSVECRGFLYFLEQVGVLDNHSREAVIDRVLALDSKTPVDLDQLKWVVSMVLFNIPGKEEAAIWLENIDACFH